MWPRASGNGDVGALPCALTGVRCHRGGGRVLQRGSHAAAARQAGKRGGMARKRQGPLRAKKSLAWASLCVFGVDWVERRR